MDAQAANNSSLYLFEKFEVGVIHMDAGRTVLAMNDLARKVLPVGEKQPLDHVETSLHRERLKPKVDCPSPGFGWQVANSITTTIAIDPPSNASGRVHRYHLGRPPAGPQSCARHGGGNR